MVKVLCTLVGGQVGSVWIQSQKHILSNKLKFELLIKFSKKTHTQQENRKLNVWFKNGGMKTKQNKNKNKETNEQTSDILRNQKWKNLLPEGITVLKKDYRVENI